jgi:hypothetical protein
MDFRESIRCSTRFAWYNSSQLELESLYYIGWWKPFHFEIILNAQFLVKPPSPFYTYAQHLGTRKHIWIGMPVPKLVSVTEGRKKICVHFSYCKMGIEPITHSHLNSLHLNLNSLCLSKSLPLWGLAVYTESRIHFLFHSLTVWFLQFLFEY